MFDAADGRRARRSLYAGTRRTAAWPSTATAAGSSSVAGGSAGSRSSTPPAIPGVVQWSAMNQLAALAFDRDGLRVLAIEWERGRLASFDPVDGSERIERISP